jgi:hypothetical protein
VNKERNVFPMTSKQPLATIREKIEYQRQHGPLPLINEEKKFIIFWMPRCGCTSTMYWFFGTLGLHESLNNLYPELGIDMGAKVHRYAGEVWEPKYWGNRSTSDILDKLTGPAYYKVAIIRNPFSRLVSAYFGLMNNRELYKAIIPDSHKNDSFAQFIEFLSDFNFYDCDIHLRYQTSSVCWDEACNLDSIIDMEQLEAGLKGISDKFDLDVQTKKLWASNKFIPAEGDCFADLSFEDLNITIKGKGRPYYKSFYTAELKEKAYQLLCVDIDKLGYSFDGKILESQNAL